jgi:hypothetical protein
VVWGLLVDLQDGGALKIANGSKVTINSCMFSANSADQVHENGYPIPLVDIHEPYFSCGERNLSGSLIRDCV